MGEQRERIAGFYWHVHHDVLLEWCYDEDGRREFIEQRKPPGEQALRLRLFQPVRGELPDGLVRAGQECDRARQEYVRARQEYDRARQEYDRARQEYVRAGQEYVRARQEYATEIEALHQKECPDCPWDGKTIFPKREGG